MESREEFIRAGVPSFSIRKKRGWRSVQHVRHQSELHRLLTGNPESFTIICSDHRQNPPRDVNAFACRRHYLN